MSFRKAERIMHPARHNSAIVERFNFQPYCSLAVQDVYKRQAMNGLILGAHGAMKTNMLDVQTFQSPNSGALGYDLNGKVFYNMEALKRDTTGSDFDVAHLDKLPKVGIRCV